MEQIAVVTGGSSGIGAALARGLAERGWRCVLLARREEPLRKLADEVGGEAEVCDVGDREAVERTAAAVLERHPQIKLLVNNAGIPARTGFVGGDPELIENVTRVNYLGGVWCLNAFLPGLLAAVPSDVVNVASVAGTVTAGTSGPYAASKHAQVSFSRAATAELHPRGVRVHTILPGFVETEGFPQRGGLPALLHPLRHPRLQPPPPSPPLPPPPPPPPLPHPRGDPRSELDASPVHLDARWNAAEVVTIVPLVSRLRASSRPSIRARCTRRSRPAAGSIRPAVGPPLADDRRTSPEFIRSPSLRWALRVFLRQPRADGAPFRATSSVTCRC